MGMKVKLMVLLTGLFVGLVSACGLGSGGSTEIRNDRSTTQTTGQATTGAQQTSVPTSTPTNVSTATPTSGPTLTPTERLAWSKQNVYDPETDTYYIPYHLWTGAYWDGNKNENVILHSADTVFLVNGVSETHVNGPETWRHPYLDKEFKVYRRAKSNRDKVQRFVFHENGIGRVYDHRPTRSDDWYYDGKEVKFPAGWGWKIRAPQTFSFTIWANGREQSWTTTIEITAIEFDHESVMTALKYNYSVNGILDHKYVYRPRIGMAVAREQVERARIETPEQVKEAIAGLSAGAQDCLRRALGDAAFAELKGGTRLPTQEEVQQGEECVAR